MRTLQPGIPAHSDEIPGKKSQRQQKEHHYNCALARTHTFIAGGPIVVKPDKSSATSKSHELNSRQIAPFSFSSLSRVACSKLALNSCSSAAESFTFSSFLQKRLFYVSNDLSPLQDHIIPVCILLNQESVVSPKQSVSLNSLILIL